MSPKNFDRDDSIIILRLLFRLGCPFEKDKERRSIGFVQLREKNLFPSPLTP